VSDLEQPRAHDHTALDRAERRFWRDIWSSAAAGQRRERGVKLQTFGPVQASVIRDLPGARMLNLVLGAGERGAIANGHLARAVSWVEEIGIDYYVPVTPGSAEAGAAERWLDEHGFEPGYSWMKFVRDVSPPDLAAPAGVEVAELGPGESETFGGIVAAGFGMPDWAQSLFSGLPAREGWRCYVAVVDGAPVASAAMLIDDGIAEFGMAATLESARGRGCQTALLRQRINDAAESGCQTLFVETGERVPDRPSGSYRNILRAGFEEAYLRPNWQRSAGS
jgi:GNAT superfamily N-acetyltransferase